MDLRKIVLSEANNLWKDNQRVFQRLNLELEYLINHNLIEEIETLQEINKYIKSHKCLCKIWGPASYFLTLYVLKITNVNPLPAFYYNPIGKTLEFSDSFKYGADLPMKFSNDVELQRNGFNLSIDYFFNQENNLYFELICNERFKDYILKNLYDKKLKWSKANIYDTKKDCILECDKLIYLNTSIVFSNEEYSVKTSTDNWESRIDDFTNYVTSEYCKEKTLPKNIELRKGYINQLNVNSEAPTFEEALWLHSFTNLQLEGFQIPKEKLYKFPVNREDVYELLLKKGVDKEEIAKIFQWKIERRRYDLNDEILENYLGSTLYMFPKAAIIQSMVFSYLTNQLKGEKNEK